MISIITSVTDDNKRIQATARDGENVFTASLPAKGHSHVDVVAKVLATDDLGHKVLNRTESWRHTDMLNGQHYFWL